MNTQQLLSKVNLSSVTPAQIGRCFLIIDQQTGERFYKVESEKDSATEYEVRYSKKGFTCTCHAGRDGFAHCKKIGVCKHCVWSLAAAMEERAALAEQARLNALPTYGTCGHLNKRSDIPCGSCLDRMTYGY